MPVRRIIKIAVMCGLVSGVWHLIISARADCGWGGRMPLLFPTNEWGSATNDCQLGLRVKKFEFATNEQILAGVVMWNLGDRRLGYTFAGSEFFDVFVTRGDGRQVPETAWWSKTKNHLEVFSNTNIPVPPHGQQEWPNCINVKKRFQMQEPGTYIISVQQHVYLLELISRFGGTNIGKFDLLSNPVKITVTNQPAELPSREKVK